MGPEAKGRNYSQGPLSGAAFAFRPRAAYNGGMRKLIAAFGIDDLEGYILRALTVGMIFGAAVGAITIHGIYQLAG